jgi:hypothetical protein
MLNVAMLSFHILFAVMLNVVILSVMAPFKKIRQGWGANTGSFGYFHLFIFHFDAELEGSTTLSIMLISIIALSIITLSTMTLSIITLSTMTLSIITLSIMKLSIIMFGIKHLA